ncbi:MAG: hypothetical protein IPJ43_16385 [Saprospiraceae bacterium]|nr:hypothetical protein [Saprospiraceae bacterium]
MKNRIIFFLLLCLGAACKPNVKESNNTTSATPTADTYGEVITPEGAASVADIMANLQANDSISGKVVAISLQCARKRLLDDFKSFAHRFYRFICQIQRLWFLYAFGL